MNTRISLLCLLLSVYTYTVVAQTYGLDTSTCSLGSDQDNNQFAINTDAIWRVSTAGILTSVSFNLVAGTGADTIKLYQVHELSTGPDVWSATLITTLPVTGTGQQTFTISNGPTLAPGDSIGAYFSSGVTACRAPANHGEDWSPTDVQSSPVTFTGTSGFDGTAALLFSFTLGSGVSGDPQFQGLQGQSYQVHGIPDEYFSLISYPDMQLNSKFVYLDSGACTYNNTACWTHPGTYVSEVGIMFPGSTHIHLIAGSHEHGCKLMVNNKVHDISHSHDHIVLSTMDNQTIEIIHVAKDQINVITSLFTFQFVNSDMFFNFGIEFHDAPLLKAGRPIHHVMNSKLHNPYPSFPLHGLIGQTWKNARYGKDKSLYEGHVEDYQVLDGLWGTQFVFNQYQA